MEFKILLAHNAEIEGIGVLGLYLEMLATIKLKRYINLTK
jgi:hypothetical protein